MTQDTHALLEHALATLTAERERIVHDIARVAQALAELNTEQMRWTPARRAAASRRTSRHMRTPAMRAMVSRRMRRYWAAWRRDHPWITHR